MKVTDLATKDEDGNWIDKHGIYYQYVRDAVVEQLGFCECGRPEENLEYVLGGLTRIRNSTYKHGEYERWVADNNAFFGNDLSRYFFYYWADKEGYTEHGGSVPGWLSKQGHELVELIEDYLQNYKGIE